MDFFKGLFSDDKPKPEEKKPSSIKPPTSASKLGSVAHIPPPAPAMESFDMFSGLNISTVVEPEVKKEEKETTFGFIETKVENVEISAFGFVEESATEHRGSVSQFDFLGGSSVEQPSMFDNLNLSSQPVVDSVVITEVNTEVSLFDNLQVAAPIVVAPVFEVNSVSVVSVATELPAMSVDNKNTVELPSQQDNNQLSGESLSESTIEDKVTRSHKEFSENLDNYWRQKLDFKTKQSVYKQEISKLNEIVVSKRLLFQEIEAQQLMAIELEQFDRADGLNLEMSGIQNQIEFSLNEINRLSKLDSEISSLLVSSAAELLVKVEMTDEELVNWKNSITLEKQSYESETQSNLKELKQNWEHANSVNELSLEDHLRKVELVAEEEKSIEDVILTKTAEIGVRKNELSLKNFELDSEISSLENKLKILKAEREVCKHQSDICDEQIKLVRMEFTEPLERLSKSRNELNRSLNSIELEKSNVLQKKVVYETANCAFELKLSSFSNLLLTISSEISKLNSIKVSMSKETSAMQLLSDAVSACTKFQEDAELEIRKFKDALTDFETKIESILGTIASLTKENSLIDSKVPQLESEKKQAISSKNFKEAGRITTDIKSAQMRQQEIASSIDSLKVEIVSLESSKKIAEENHLIILSQSNAKAKHLDCAHIIALQTYMNLLKARISDDSGKDQGQSYILNLCSILQKEFDSYVTMLLQKYELTDLSELIDSSSLLDNNLPVENTVDIEVMASVEEIHSLDTLLTQLESLKQEQQIAKTSLSEQNIAIEFAIEQEDFDRADSLQLLAESNSKAILVIAERITFLENKLQSLRSIEDKVRSEEVSVTNNSEVQIAISSEIDLEVELENANRNLEEAKQKNSNQTAEIDEAIAREDYDSADLLQVSADETSKIIAELENKILNLQNDISERNS